MKSLLLLASVLFVAAVAQGPPKPNYALDGVWVKHDRAGVSTGRSWAPREGV
jgi:hypothetical protein